MSASIKDDLKFVLIVILFYSLLHAGGIGCPIKFLTGISCAGCGMLRAWLCILKLDYSEAFYYHPLFPLPLVGLVLYLFRARLPRKLLELSFLVMVILFIGVYSFRLLAANDHIVEINPGYGLIGRLITNIAEGLR